MHYWIEMNVCCRTFDVVCGTRRSKIVPTEMMMTLNRMRAMYFHWNYIQYSYAYNESTNHNNLQHSQFHILYKDKRHERKYVIDTIMLMLLCRKSHYMQSIRFSAERNNFFFIRLFCGADWRRDIASPFAYAMSDGNKDRPRVRPFFVRFSFRYCYCTFMGILWCCVTALLFSEVLRAVATSGCYELLMMTPFAIYFSLIQIEKRMFQIAFTCFQNEKKIYVRCDDIYVDIEIMLCKSIVNWFSAGSISTAYCITVSVLLCWEFLPHSEKRNHFK